MQQNLVLTNIPFDAQKPKLNLYFSFCNANNHASVFHLPYVYLSILKVEHFPHSLFLSPKAFGFAEMV